MLVIVVVVLLAVNVVVLAVVVVVVVVIAFMRDDDTISSPSYLCLVRKTFTLAESWADGGTEEDCERVRRASLRHEVGSWQSPISETATEHRPNGAILCESRDTINESCYITDAGNTSGHGSYDAGSWKCSTTAVQWPWR